MRTRFLRPVAVMATVVACLLMFQSPASAVTHSADIADGTLTLTKMDGTVPGLFPLFSLAPTGGCPTGTLQLDITTTTADITSFSVQHPFTMGTGTWVMVITRTGSTAGTISGTNLTSLGLGLNITIYNNSGSCVLGTRVCGFNTTLSFSGTITGSTTSDTGTLSTPMADLTLVPTCGPPFVILMGGEAAVTDLYFHLTT
jgi:hypothetical protein